MLHVKEAETKRTLINLSSFRSIAVNLAITHTMTMRSLGLRLGSLTRHVVICALRWTDTDAHECP